MVRLRVVVRGVSPLIVRTVEVPAEATLQLLHEALLVCLDWSGQHLHVFTIRAVDYSADWMIDGIDTRNVTLDSLALRVGERFTWSYDFTAGWVIELRVESVAGETACAVRCVSGRRRGPPEGVAVRAGSGRGRTHTACSSSSSA